jgi:archaellum component FlaC
MLFRGGFMTNDDVGQAILQAVERINGRLDGLEGRLGRVESGLHGLKARMSTIEHVVAELNTELKSWPDMHFLAASAKAQATHTRELRADVSDIKVRMSEIYQSMAI